jgi:hypothetical protein
VKVRSPGAVAYSQKTPISFFVSACLSVRLFDRLSACISLASAGRILVKFDSEDFLANYSRKSKFWYNRKKLLYMKT